MSLIPETQALAVDAWYQDWQGRSMYMFRPFPLLNKVIQKLRATQAAEVILHGGCHSRGSHTYFHIVWTTPCSFHTPEIYCLNRVREFHLRRKIVPSACMEALMRHFKTAGFSDEVSRLAAAPWRPSITGPQGKDLIRLILWLQAHIYQGTDLRARHIQGCLKVIAATYLDPISRFRQSGV